MRIGIMLRHLKDQRGGIGTYTRNIVNQLVKNDRNNQYFFLYKDKDLIGSYAHYPNVEEVVVNGSTKLIWDQVAVPRIAKSKKIDLIFNPKSSIPLTAPCKKVLVLHGADWFVFPQNYNLFDRFYHKMSGQLYCEHASAIISVSEDATKRILENTRINPEKIKTIYHGVSKHFRPIENREELEKIRNKYKLPEHFALFVGQIYPMKNVGGIIEAFFRLSRRIQHKLVIVGKPELKYKKELALIDKYNLRDEITRTGWIPDEDLPAFYNLAELFIFPSLYEGFGIPLLEAMACGCPIVTSNRGATREVVGDAAILVDPRDPEGIATAMYDVLTHKELRQDLIERGFKRVGNFSWEKHCFETLVLFESLNGKRV